MKLLRLFAILIFLMAVVISIFACGQESAKTVQNTFTFDVDEEGWSGGFADLPVDHAQQGYDVSFSHAKIPTPDAESNGLFITGNNHSDDLFMYIVRGFGLEDDLKATTQYNVSLSFKMATEVPPGMMGIGGSPGESVYIKAGVTDKKPEAIEQSGNYVMNIDHGSQSQSGSDATVIGDAAKAEGPGQDDMTFQYKKFELTQEITSDSEGRLWIIIGADSGFEGITRLYFDDISVTFDPVVLDD
ncbi:hypothetical protein ACFLXY_00360 [Chloroflexota bacterium]